MRKLNWIDILIILLFLLAVYFILTRIFGHSASDLTITISLFTVLAMALYKLNREVGEIKIGMRNGFSRIKEDINSIKNKLKIK